MNDKTLLKIGGACGLLSVAGEAAGYAWAASVLGIAADVFDLEPGQALPLIRLYCRELQFFLSGLILGSIIAILFWLALYDALKESKTAYAVLGVVAGVLSAAVTIVFTLPQASVLPVLARMYPAADESSRAAAEALFYAVSRTGSGFLLTALRIPRIGFISLALPRSRKFSQTMAWLGIATAALTLVEMGLWITRGSPNDPLPVGWVAATLGRIWVILAGVWLLRLK